jgi:hypothetical protein
MNPDSGGFPDDAGMSLVAEDACLWEAEKAFAHGEWNQALDSIERYDVWIRSQYASLDIQRITRLMATLHGVIERLTKSRGECAQAMRALNDSKSASSNYRSSKLGVFGNEP